MLNILMYYTPPLISDLDIRLFLESLSKLASYKILIFWLVSVAELAETELTNSIAYVLYPQYKCVVTRP